MITKEPIERVGIEVPEQLKRGETASVTVQVSNVQGKSVSAVIPIEVAIEDSEGRIAEMSGYRALVDGKQTFQIQIAPNDKAGIWRVHVKELASGKSSSAHFRVIDENPSHKPSYNNIKGFNPAQPAG